MEELLIPTKIIKSKRKSISLIIKNNGDFIVRAPLKSTESDIFKFIAMKSKWIILKRIEQQSNSFQPITFEKPEKISLLGKIYDIVLTNTSRVKLLENRIEVPQSNPKEKLIKFLKNYTRKYVTERALLISNLFNLEFSRITISSAKTCWGSCSQNNTLHFTYKLIMCPEDVIDYIVLHELCHTKIKNHSQKFWNLVETCNPNYKTQERWLKKNRGIIEVI